MAEGSSPHGLITQLYDGAIDYLSIVSKQDDSNNKIRQHYLTKSIAVVQELQASLHQPDTNDLSGNLFMLYGYIIDQMMLANRDYAKANISACINILDSLKSAWVQIGPTRPAI